MDIVECPTDRDSSFVDRSLRKSNKTIQGNTHFPAVLITMSKIAPGLERLGIEDRTLLYRVKSLAALA